MPCRILGHLETGLHELEIQLLGLEDMCEEKDVNTNRQQHYMQLDLHKKRKNLELDKVKSMMLFLFVSFSTIILKGKDSSNLCIKIIKIAIDFGS